MDRLKKKEKSLKYPKMIVQQLMHKDRKDTGKIDWNCSGNRIKKIQ